MAATEIAQVRRFNRTVTRRIGVLNQSFLGRGRPLSEARLLYEIGADGEDLRDLRRHLSLDSGYLTRLTQSLEKQGLLRIRPSKDDARVRRAELTAKGRREVDELDRRSDVFADALLQPLTATQRERLLVAMTEVERLMNASAVNITVEEPTSADGQWCLQSFFADLAERFDTGFDPDVSHTVSPDEIRAPDGLLLLARLDGRPIGCVALRVLRKQIGEIKHMWVDPNHRGLGVAKRLIGTLEDHARDMGLRRLRLDTNAVLIEARTLYAQLGYQEVDAFNDEPYAQHWFEKRDLRKR